MNLNLKDHRKIMLVYGSGGHNEQMKRLQKCLEEKGIDSNQMISIIDHEVKHILTDKSIRLKPLSSKYSYVKAILNFLNNLFYNFVSVKKYVSELSPTCFISTGPGVAIIPLIYCKSKGIKTIYLESWSRFETRSLTGVIAYYVADLYIVQNAQLKEKHRKSMYLGRL